jgi:hypothetical protein
MTERSRDDERPAAPADAPQPPEPYEPLPAQPGNDYWKKSIDPNPRIERRHEDR